MAQPFAGSVTLSSAGVSPGLMLDPTARVTQIQLVVPSSGNTVDLTIQGTLDVGNPAIPGQVLFWDNISTTHYSSGTGGIDGAMLQLQCPIAGLRLASSTFVTTTQAATLKVLQLIFG